MKAGKIACAAALIVAGFCSMLGAAEPSQLWPRQVDLSQDKGVLKGRVDALANAGALLPQGLGSAVRFQKVFLSIMGGAPREEWSGEVEKLANLTGQTPVEAGVREVARAWLCRLQMADIDVVLRNYYRRNVRFPAALAEVEPGIPENIRKDPWGEGWIYQPHAPQGFKLSAQRYQLGPARFPKLGMLDEATTHRDPPGKAWQITLRDIAGNKALEFRLAEAGASMAIIQPGGKVGDCTLLFVADHWALMAGVDQLFAVSY